VPAQEFLSKTRCDGDPRGETIYRIGDFPPIDPVSSAPFGRWTSVMN